MSSRKHKKKSLSLQQLTKHGLLNTSNAYGDSAGYTLLEYQLLKHSDQETPKLSMDFPSMSVIEKESQADLRAKALLIQARQEDIDNRNVDNRNLNIYRQEVIENLRRIPENDENDDDTQSMSSNRSNLTNRSINLRNNINYVNNGKSINRSEDTDPRPDIFFNRDMLSTGSRISNQGIPILMSSQNRQINFSNPQSPPINVLHSRTYPFKNNQIAIQQNSSPAVNVESRPLPAQLSLGVNSIPSPEQLSVVVNSIRESQDDEMKYGNDHLKPPSNPNNKQPSVSSSSSSSSSSIQVKKEENTDVLATVKKNVPSKKDVAVLSLSAPPLKHQIPLDQSQNLTHADLRVPRQPEMLSKYGNMNNDQLNSRALYILPHIFGKSNFIKKGDGPMLVSIPAITAYAKSLKINIESKGDYVKYLSGTQQHKDRQFLIYAIDEIETALTNSNFYQNMADEEVSKLKQIKINKNKK
jgi:hypothetical protein